MLNILTFWGGRQNDDNSEDLIMKLTILIKKQIIIILKIKKMKLIAKNKMETNKMEN